MIDAQIDTSSEGGRYENTSATIINQLSDRYGSHAERQYGIESQRWIDFCRIFQAMYDTPNQPTASPEERSDNALFKAAQIADIARERVGEHASVESLDAVDSITKTKTHNVVVTYGDTATGPTVVYMVHHDTIERARVPLRIDDTSEQGVAYLQGPAVQDDTLPLVAALTGLDQIRKPDIGAIMVVFTDHEENGCRGSSAILNKLTERISPHHPVALIAAESTNGQLAIGHKGKFSSDVHFSEETAAQPSDAFIYFYQNLKTVQRVIGRQNTGDGLVPTTGVSTYGEALHTDADNHFTAKLDFRTGNVTRPADVRSLWKSSFTGGQTIVTAEDLVEEARELMRKSNFTYEIKDNKIIVRSAEGSPKHPSKYDLDNDQTVLPGLFLASWMAKIHALPISAIRWNTPNTQNSNPLVGEIEFHHNLGFSTEELVSKIYGVTAQSRDNLGGISDAVNEVAFQLVEAPGASTPEVLSPSDARCVRILQAFSPANPHDLVEPYMTDIARAFDALSSDSRRSSDSAPVYGFVQGKGDPDRLHRSDERVSIDDVYREILDFPRLLHIVHEKLLEAV